MVPVKGSHCSGCESQRHALHHVQQDEESHVPALLPVHWGGWVTIFASSSSTVFRTAIILLGSQPMMKVVQLQRAHTNRVIKHRLVVDMDLVFTYCCCRPIAAAPHG